MVETSIGGAAREFPDTRWTLILSTRGDPAARRRALEDLLGLYWKPLYFFARRKGLDIESAKDAVQGFCAHLLEGDVLARVDKEKGKLRSYLRTSLDHYVANLREANQAKKRGGEHKILSLDVEGAEGQLGRRDEDPGKAFDREWATGVMERALAALRREFESGKRSGPFELALRFFGVGEAPSYADAAKEAGMTQSQLKAFLHRARVRFRELVKDEVKETTDGEDPDAEIDHLLRALAP